MSIDPAEIKKAGDRIRSAQKFLLVSHIRPDGDAVGSLLGFGLALEAVGKKVQMVLRDGVPSTFRHLKESDRVRKSAEGEFDLICTLDCSDLERVGDILEGRFPLDLNIDHHRTNNNFAKLNLVDEYAVATCELIAEFLSDWDLPLSHEVAEALLTGIITDTIGFQTSNMQPDALRVSANLMEAGANLPFLYQHALGVHSYEAMRLWGIGLANLERNEKMIWTTISLKERASINYPGHDAADLSNFLGKVEDASIAMVFTEQSDNHIKVSWRSQTGYDVSKVAMNFGGGGHPAASGALIQGSLPEVKKKIIAATILLINSQKS